MQNTATYIGVFSRRERTAKGMVAKKMYFAWESQKAFLVQELDRAYQPTGSPMPVDKKEFSRAFVQEKQIHAQPDGAEPASPKQTASPAETSAAAQDETPPKKSAGLPDLSGLEGLGEFGELPRTDAEEKKAPPAAEEGKKSGLGLGAGHFLPEPGENKQSAQRELELRESFRKAILRLKRPRDRDAALRTLQNLSDVEEGIEQVHKHMFADFGVSLRQNTLLELALHCCQRVLELAPDDDHAHFNAARILFEMNRYDDSKKHLMQAMEIDPDEPLYARMLRHVEKMQIVTAQNKSAGAKVETISFSARDAVSVK